MENNASKSKKLLEQALKLLPREFALSNARAYLNRAISEVASVEAKRESRARTNKTLQENLRLEDTNPPVYGRGQPLRLLHV